MSIPALLDTVILHSLNLSGQRVFSIVAPLKILPTGLSTLPLTFWITITQWPDQFLKLYAFELIHKICLFNIKQLESNNLNLFTTII